jgi:DNA-directed RNA polymerase subunit RPC12/RpoP
MQLEFQCRKCDDSFEVEASDLIAEPEVRCPGCGAKVSVDQAEALADALEELFASIAAVRRKFSVSAEVDSEDLPAPYDEDQRGPARRKPALLDEEEEDEADE